MLWPGFVLLSLTALVLRAANQRVFRPGDVVWRAGAAAERAPGRRRVRAGAWATLVTLVLAAAIVVGSRNLQHFDAALVGYTFATLFATFGITYRYAMWLQRPPTRDVLAARLAGVPGAAARSAATLRRSRRRVRRRRSPRTASSSAAAGCAASRTG